MKSSIAIRNLKSVGFCLALSAGLFVYSCSDSDDDASGPTSTASAPYVCTTCAASSEALPEYDTNERGIYKGVFSGGSLVINYRNNNTKASGVVYYKNRAIPVEETIVESVTHAKPVLTMFKGSLDKNEIILFFSVNGDGSVPVISDFTISGERGIIDCTIFKETSRMLIEAYEGNYYISNTVNSSGGPDPASDKVEPDFDNSNVVTNVGSLKLVLSRSEAMWMLYKTMNNSPSHVIDHGSINDGTLLSDVSGKNMAFLKGDELNFREKVSSQMVYMHAERKR